MFLATEYTQSKPRSGWEARNIKVFLGTPQLQIVMLEEMISLPHGIWYTAVILLHIRVVKRELEKLNSVTKKRAAGHDLYILLMILGKA